MKHLKRNLIIAAAALVVLFGLETFFRFKYDLPDKFSYALRPAYVNCRVLFPQSVVPRKKDSRPRIFCVGGETTEGGKFAKSGSYPEILQWLLNSNTQPGTVYNAGIRGGSSATTYAFLRRVIPRYKPDWVVIHDGYNDLPLISKKLEDDLYEYCVPDYNDPHNPYINNYLFNYIASLIKYNFTGTRVFLQRITHGGNDDFFGGFHYRKEKVLRGTPKDIFREHIRRTVLFSNNELGAIDYCRKRGIKVVVILEPKIAVFHAMPGASSAFPDRNVAPVLAECHRLQQEGFHDVLCMKYKDDPGVTILDMREIFKDSYAQAFYDEYHLTPEGNAIKAGYLFKLLNYMESAK